MVVAGVGSLGVGVSSSWSGRVEIVPWIWDELDGMVRPARWSQRLASFRLPFGEVEPGGIGGMLGRKCISSVSMASC